MGMVDLCCRNYCGKFVDKKETERRTCRLGQRIDQGELRSGYSVYKEAGILRNYFFDRLYFTQYMVLVMKEKKNV